MKIEITKENDIKQPQESIKYICPECDTVHEAKDLVMADNGIDYSYYCKNCGELIESNGTYYGK